MDISLRQKKLYKTKLALALSFVEKMKTEKFEAISIKDICNQMDICEATFFNYFPQKIDVISYLFKLKLFKIYWIINSQKDLSFTKSIEKIFELFAKEIKDPYLFFEVIAIFKNSDIKPESINISHEELQYIYPECGNVEKISIISLKDFFEEKLSNARRENLIPNIYEKTLVQFLLTILKGVPLSTPISQFDEIAEIYQKHLSILWKIFQL